MQLDQFGDKCTVVKPQSMPQIYHLQQFPLTPLFFACDKDTK